MLLLWSCYILLATALSVRALVEVLITVLIDLPTTVSVFMFLSFGTLYLIMDLVGLFHLFFPIFPSW